MNLLTLNVHAWLEEDQEAKIRYLADVIAEKDYDVIALQEVNQSISAPKVMGEVRSDNYGIVLLDLLKEKGITDYHYYWSPSHIGYDVYEEGVALLTRDKVLEVENFYTSKSQDMHTIDSRKIIKLQLEVDNQVLEIYSCHMNLPSSRIENQQDNLQRLVQHSDFSGLKIFLGDFNTDAIGSPQAYQVILDQGLLDTYQLAQEKDDGITASKAIDGWADQLEGKRLDYVFLNQERSVSASRVIFNNRYKQVVSDHFGLEVTINI
ncbi:endonuclease/exonuclease/phosphatase family protein [Streptococcus dentapri]|uniref:Endonuclease/exonuclease/phosphatase family protein n=1 Tax=Streptococcus dentapri TaxID=573564 RepID=A0ABV8D203_9STRE